MSAQPANESRRTLYVGIAVAVLLAVSVAVAAARPEPTAKPPAKPATKPAVPKPSAVATPSVNATAAPGAAPATPGSKPSPGAAPNSSASAPAKKPTSPVQKGEKLVDLKAPPERTIGMITVPDDFKGARFSVTFTPYGWGPAGDAGGRLVVKITKSTPADDAAKALGRDFTNRNATLWCGKALTEQITVGGSYEGTIEVRREGETGILVLTELKNP